MLNLELWTLPPPTTRSRRPNEPTFSKLESVYPKDGVAIATKKYQDIHNKLLQYIPPVQHKQYMVKHATKRKNLYKYSKQVPTELDGFVVDLLVRLV